ncbi:hypothetical protein FSP39_014154 [Pinctada imbricata]|uniref:J domain-containing protein n=1 Tax=Pinctada imbricata TaxID=66713 RepID=A0AA89BZE3_PINIB|nr:hypothetical protein FSP39_014154 [Pinctada imbricata]
MYSSTCLLQYRHKTRLSVLSIKFFVARKGVGRRFYAARQIHRDPYTVLKIKRGASKEEIKAAYLDLSKKHHPDVNTTDPQAKQKFVEINEAYTELMGTGDSGRKNIRTQVYDTWNYRDRSEYRYDYTTYNFASKGMYSNSWKAFLREKRQSDDIFWKDYFRRNDSKDEYVLNQEEKDRVQREFYEWHSHVYGNYRQYSYHHEQTGFRFFFRSFVVQVAVLYAIFQLFILLCIGLQIRGDGYRTSKSSDFKDFEQKMKHEEIIYGSTYANHKDRKRKQKQRNTIEDELKKHHDIQTYSGKKRDLVRNESKQVNSKTENINTVETDSQKS